MSIMAILKGYAHLLSLLIQNGSIVTYFTITFDP